MGKVLYFSTLKNRQAGTGGGQTGGFTELLRMAPMPQPENKTIVMMDFQGLKRTFESMLADIILRIKGVGADLCSCGDYVAALLVQTAFDTPDSWFTVDYFTKAATENNPTVLRQGADTCFLICSVFPDRRQINNIRLGDYEALGKRMYYKYYSRTGIKVAYLMSNRFKIMSAIARECLQKIK